MREGKVSQFKLRVHHVVKLPDVSVDRGVNDKLSQETTDMTTGASLISLQLYQAPCHHSKCHLSPCDWDRKPSKASCHKHRFGILQKPVSLFWGLSFFFFFFGWGFYLSLALPFFLYSLSTHTHMHMGTHTHVHSKKCFHLWKTTLSLRHSLKQLGTRQAAWHFFLSGKLGYFSMIFFPHLALSPVCKSSVKAHSPYWEYITMH